VNTRIYTLDRFEGEKAVLLLRSDEKEELTVEKEKIKSPKEGDIIEITFTEEGDILSSKVLEKETEEAKNKANELLNKLRKK
jgi:hypothetical protein